MHEIDARQEFVSRVDAVEVLTRNAHELRQAGAGADKYRIVTLFFEQFVNCHRASDDDIGFEFDAHRAHVVDLLANDFFR